MFKRLPIDVDYQKLADEVQELNLVELLMANLNQIALQHRGVAPEKQLTDSCQSLLYDWEKFNPLTDSSPPTRSEILDEHLFDIPCDFFKNTYIGHVVTELRIKYNVYRGRMMLSRHKTCLTMHTDPSPRLHIPIITNPDAFMVVNNEVVYLPFGGVYVVDTRQRHTAINSGTKHRIHLVFCVDDY